MTPGDVCIMFAEKLNDVLGHLVAHMTVDALFLSFMRPVIFNRENSDIKRVCTLSLLVFILWCHHSSCVGHTVVIVCFFLRFNRRTSKNREKLY